MTYAEGHSSLAGVQYREMEIGTGSEATVGSVCGISYAVYRLASGAYFKYSSGGKRFGYSALPWPAQWRRLISSTL